MVEHDETLANPLNILESKKKVFTALTLKHREQKSVQIVSFTIPFSKYFFCTG